MQVDRCAVQIRQERVGSGKGERIPKDLLSGRGDFTGDNMIFRSFPVDVKGATKGY